MHRIYRHIVCVDGAWWLVALVLRQYDFDLITSEKVIMAR